MGVGAVYSWLVLSRDSSNDFGNNIISIHVNGVDIVFTEKQRVVLYILAVVSTIATVISIFGLIGAIARKRKLIQAFFALVFLETLASLGICAYYLYELWSGDSTQALATCKSLGNAVDADTCRDGIKIVRFVVTATIAVSWLIQIWILHGIHAYSKQLKEEAAYQAVSTILPMRIPAEQSGPGPYYDDPYYKQADYAFATPHTAIKSV